MAQYQSMVSQLLAKFQTQQDAANKANEKRYAEMQKLADENIAMFGEGGSYGAGAEAAIERAGTKAVAGGQQALVNAGLANTTVAAGVRKNWEEEVGTPARLRVQDTKAEKLAAARESKIGVTERRTDQGPDYAAIAQLAMQAGNRPSAVRKKTYTASPIPTDYAHPWDKNFMGGGWSL